ncbi:hypothetical protein ACFO0S_09310 [Chryseomicrobium palamuruense]|uniref:Uncharacterized protein n=1 Tax=Chryseomicrobium palamuruense TaxID=682973 RepID=A0ABV8UWQ1_9BACL
MKKTLKTKMIAGTTAVALFSGAGFAFANTNAGDAFKAWYDGQFGRAETHVAQQVAAYAYGKEQDARTYYAAELSKLNTQIDNERKDQKDAKSNSMDAKAQGHIDSMNAEKTEILNGMEGQFLALESEVKGIIDFAADELEKAANTHFEGKATEAGDAAFTSLQTDLNTAKGDANNKLSDAITAAKGDVNRALRTNTNDSVGELKGYLDEVYAQLKLDVTAIVDGYITTQKERLAAEATRIEGESTSDLDTIVSNINK